jgi:conjugal transfer pilus assembly protein TraE
MKLEFLQQNIHKRISERNVWLGISGALVISNVLLGAALLYKRERVVLVPPQITKSFWVQGHEVSKEYLEEIGLYMSKLLLDLSPSSFVYNHEVLLKYATPEAYGNLKQQLLQEGEQYKSLQLTTHFKPSQITANPKNLEVEVQGTLTSYVAGRRVDDSQETLFLKFTNRGGGLLLEKVTSPILQKEKTTGENYGI